MISAYEAQDKIPPRPDFPGNGGYHLPFPILGVILMYVLLQRPPWFRNVVTELYDKAEETLTRQLIEFEKIVH